VWLCKEGEKTRNEEIQRGRKKERKKEGRERERERERGRACACVYTRADLFNVPSWMSLTSYNIVAVSEKLDFYLAYRICTRI
jgi:hypothetical protein